MLCWPFQVGNHFTIYHFYHPCTYTKTCTNNYFYIFVTAVTELICPFDLKITSMFTPVRSSLPKTYEVSMAFQFWVSESYVSDRETERNGKIFVFPLVKCIRFRRLTVEWSLFGVNWSTFDKDNYAHRHFYIFVPVTLTFDLLTSDLLPQLLVFKDMSVRNLKFLRLSNFE